ncbi:hypothetical protein EV363DRAFT_1405868 [Boletus edulis]|nr:hypothetical protein EV363DRAFT_1405868 [Boletus edulis]
MDPIIPSGKYILSLPTTAGTYYLGPLQDKPDTIGVLPEDISPRPIFTLTNEGDQYKILIGGGCKKWRIVSSGNETCMSVFFSNWRRIKGGDDSCWSCPGFPAQKLAGCPVMDAATCRACSEECMCVGVNSLGEHNKCDIGTCPGCRGGIMMPLCTVCPPSCIHMMFVPV